MRGRPKANVKNKENRVVNKSKSVDENKMNEGTSSKNTNNGSNDLSYRDCHSIGRRKSTSSVVTYSLNSRLFFDVYAKFSSDAYEVNRKSYGNLNTSNSNSDKTSPIKHKNSAVNIVKDVNKSISNSNSNLPESSEISGNVETDLIEPVSHDESVIPSPMIILDTSFTSNSKEQKRKKGRRNINRSRRKLTNKNKTKQNRSPLVKQSEFQIESPPSSSSSSAVDQLSNTETFQKLLQNKTIFKKHHLSRNYPASARLKSKGKTAANKTLNNDSADLDALPLNSHNSKSEKQSNNNTEPEFPCPERQRRVASLNAAAIINCVQSTYFDSPKKSPIKSKSLSTRNHRNPLALENNDNDNNPIEKSSFHNTDENESNLANNKTTTTKSNTNPKESSKRKGRPKKSTDNNLQDNKMEVSDVPKVELNASTDSQQNELALKKSSVLVKCSTTDNCLERTSSITASDNNKKEIKSNNLSTTENKLKDNKQNTKQNHSNENNGNQKRSMEKTIRYLNERRIVVDNKKEMKEIESPSNIIKQNPDINNSLLFQKRLIYDGIKIQKRITAKPEDNGKIPVGKNVCVQKIVLEKDKASSIVKLPKFRKTIRTTMDNKIEINKDNNSKDISEDSNETDNANDSSNDFLDSNKLAIVPVVDKRKEQRVYDFSSSISSPSSPITNHRRKSDNSSMKRKSSSSSVSPSTVLESLNDEQPPHIIALSKKKRKKDVSSIVPIEMTKDETAKKKDNNEIGAREDDSSMMESLWNWEGDPHRKFIQLSQKTGESAIECTCYPAIRHTRDGVLVRVGDSVILRSDNEEQPFIAKTTAFYFDVLTGKKMMTILWYYRPEHTEIGRLPWHTDSDLYASRHLDINSVDCIEDKAFVLPVELYGRFIAFHKRQNITTRPSLAGRLIPLNNEDMNIPQPDEKKVILHNKDLSLDLFVSDYYFNANIHTTFPPEMTMSNVFVCRGLYDIKDERTTFNIVDRLRQQLDEHQQQQTTRCGSVNSAMSISSVQSDSKIPWDDDNVKLDRSVINSHDIAVTDNNRLSIISKCLLPPLLSPVLVITQDVNQHTESQDSSLSVVTHPDSSSSPPKLTPNPLANASVVPVCNSSPPVILIRQNGYK